ncbi:MAG: hypothetical protein C0498_01465 [Anaerolinea sp.]|nr:hypothetical protein [Anaerolinea sp.]
MARPTEAKLRRTRELIERFHLAGYSAERIRVLLAGAKNEKGEPDPIHIGARQVREHIKAIRDGHLAYVSPNEDIRADMIAQARSVLAEATQGAAAKRGTVLEIANQKLRLDAAKRIAELAGIDVRRVELTGAAGGPVRVESSHPLDALSPEEQARRFRLHADELEAAARDDTEEA